MYSIYADGVCVYHDVSTLDSVKVLSPRLVLEDNAAGSLNMTVPVTNAGYSIIVRMDTDIVVKRDGTEIWAGRVLTERQDLWKNRVLYCEGELAFLNDTTQPQAEYHDMTVRGFLTALIDIHNSKVSDNRKFVVGTVTVVDNNDSLYRYTNYEKTIECINEKLINRLGGHLRVRKVNGIRYLDYLADSPNTNTQTIEFGKNLVDFTRNWDMTEYATVILPLGETLEESPIAALDAYLTVESVNDGSKYVVSADAMQEHGWIEKVVHWDDVSVPANLLNKARAYLADVQFDNLSIELSALDMHYYNVSYEAVKLLDKIRVISRPHGMDRYFPVTKLDIPLDAPEETVFTLGDTVTSGLTSVNNKTNSAILQKINDLPKKQEMLAEAKANATAIMTMATNGYITITQDENGSNALYVTDSRDYRNATKMWLLNMNGFGYSSDGGRNFGLAITMDGAIVADYITAGTLNGDIIRAGTIKTAAISQEFKNYISNEIGEGDTAVTQAFQAADGNLLSQITADISASETRSRTLIRQTEDSIEVRADLKYSTKEDIQSLEQLFLTYVDFEDSNGEKILDNRGEVIQTRTTADGITAVEVESMIRTSATSVETRVMENVQRDYTSVTDFNTLSNNYTDLSKDYYGYGSTKGIRARYLETVQTVSEIQASVGEISLTVSRDVATKTELSGVSDRVTTIEQNYYTKAQLTINGTTIQQYVQATRSTANATASAVASIQTTISNDLRPSIALKVEADEVVSAINMSSDTISLTSGRLIITSGNFRLNASGNMTAANATLTSASITGSITSGDTTGYRTKIDGGTLETYYDNRRISVIVPVGDSECYRAGFLASTNYHGLTFGKITNGDITNYYSINLDGDGYNQFGCRHYFVGDVKFTNGNFKSSVNFANNYGVAWGGNTGLLYRSSGTYGSGIYVGINNSSTSCDIHAIGSSIKFHAKSYIYSQMQLESTTLKMQSSNINFDSDYGIQWGGNTGLRYVSSGEYGVWLGISNCPTYLNGSSIRFNADVDRPISFSSNYGVAWGGNTGLLYKNTSSISGLYLGITGHDSTGTDISCPTVLTGSEIRYSAYVNTGMTFWNDMGIRWITTPGQSDKNVKTGIQFRRNASPWGLWVGIDNYPTMIVGSQIRCEATLYNSSGQVISSDRRVKKDISDIDDRYYKLLDSLTGKLYRYKSGRSDAINVGFIAQELIGSMNDAGLGPNEFGAIYDVNGDGSEYGIDYIQFIPILWELVKRLDIRLNDIERRRMA